MIGRYACPAIADHWSEDTKLSHWLQVWWAASGAIGHPWAAIGSGYRTAVRLRAAELETHYGHDVAAACEALREQLTALGEVDAAHWLHYGLCSSDVADSGLWLSCQSVTNELVDLAEVARTGVMELSSDETPALHRTHGQPARVTTAGSRWARAQLNLSRGIWQLQQAAKRLSLPVFAGPVGVEGELSMAQRRKLRSALAGAEIGAGNPAAGQAVGRDDYVQWLQAVSRLGVACERFGRDVRLLASTGEVAEGRGPEYRGSSSMPHKRNPTRSERLCGLAPVVRGLVSGYQEAAAECWDAHSLEHSSAERVCVPAVTELVGFMLTEVYGIAATLTQDSIAKAAARAELVTDSYAQRNRLIREGVDGGEAYERARVDPWGPFVGDA